MQVIFVHGWSVTDTGTYAYLPQAIAKQGTNQGLALDIKEIWLGRYISFDDEVSIGDVTRAFEQAMRDEVPGYGTPGHKFSCITHSTGGPVVREWMERYWGADNLSACPLEHLVMLAPANHGSPLAKLGKKRVGRIKAWFQGMEPGERILQWLSLGSEYQIELAERYLDYKPVENGFFPFVLTGQTIDKKFYNFVDKYLVEPGSDGVVRVAGANMNYSMVRLTETNDIIQINKDFDDEIDIDANKLDVDGGIRRPEPSALGVVANTSHSGRDKGIMGAVRNAKSKRAQVGAILNCLKVDDAQSYNNQIDALNQMTQKTQGAKPQFVNLVFSIKDDQGDPINDYDLFLLGGPKHIPSALTKGFFQDRQQNTESPNHLVYYINHTKIVQKELTGFRVVARPAQSQERDENGNPPKDGPLVYYHPVEYRSDGVNLNEVLQPNETLYIEIVLKRRVDKNVFRLDPEGNPPLKNSWGLTGRYDHRRDFKDKETSGDEVET